jgi:hypothetical protein
MPNISALVLWVFKRRYLKFLLLVAMATRVLHGIEFFGDHQRNIPVKFGCNFGPENKMLVKACDKQIYYI